MDLLLVKDGLPSLETIVAATNFPNAKTKGSFEEWPCSMNSQYLISGVEIMIIYIEFTRLLRCSYCSSSFLHPDHFCFLYVDLDVHLAIMPI